MMSLKKVDSALGAALVLATVVLAVVMFGVGYNRGKAEAFWDEFASNLAVTKIVALPDGLTEDGARKLAQMSDIWIYGYFTTPHKGLSESKQKEIEDHLLDVIRWKIETGQPVGLQEPLVQIGVNQGVTTNRPMDEKYHEYREAFDQFLRDHGIVIPPPATNDE